MLKKYFFLEKKSEHHIALLNFNIKLRVLIVLIFTLAQNLSFSQGTNCATATPLNLNGDCAIGHTISDNTQDAPNISECSAGTFRREGWYSFEITGGTTDVVITARATSRNLYLQLISSSTNDCGGMLTQIACANNVDNNNTQTEIITTTLGNGTYYIKAVNIGSNNNMVLNSLCINTSSALNDECAGAIPLNINATCTYSSFTNYQATSSSGVVNPTCANYQGRDVWFSVVVPPSGNITVDTNTGVMTDSGMSIYSGNCGSLTQIQCNDNGSSNGNMSLITLTNRIPGETLYIRIWSKGTTAVGTFRICITEPIISYCTPSTATANQMYINRVDFVGTLNDVSNTSTFSTSPSGYQNFTGLPNKAVQAQGEGVNLYVQGPGQARWKAWVDWNKDGDFDDAGEEIYNPGAYGGPSAGFGFIIPANTPPGDYRIRIRNHVRRDNLFGSIDWGVNFNSCEAFTNGGLFGYSHFGEAEDYLFTVIPSCSANITGITPGEICGSGTVELNVTGTAGVTGYNWYTTPTGGTPVTTSSENWTTPVINTTTTYYVTATNGTCESLTRTPIVARVTPLPNLSFTPENPIVCGENIVLSLTAAGDTELVHLINENFEGSGLGVFTNINLDPNSNTVDGKTRWQNRTSPVIPSGIVWFPAVSSGLAGNQFVIAVSDISPNPAPNPVENALTLTSNVSSVDFLDLTLKMKMYYARYLPDFSTAFDDYVSIEVSTNNGSTWTVIHNYLQDVGIGTNFEEVSFDLSAYINQPTLKIRVRHYSWSSATGWLPGGVAIDNVELFGTKTLSTAFEWDSVSVIDAYEDFDCTTPYISGTPATTVYIKPTLSQLEQSIFTYTVSAVLSGGCYVSDDITITNNTKIWQGFSTEWNSASNWRPLGVPTANTCVIIPDNTIISGSGYDAYAKNITVKPTGNLELQSNNNLIVTDWIDINSGGGFDIENNASLIQINNNANTGNARMFRTTQIRRLDYVYWSSPVENFLVNQVSPGTPASNIFHWNPTVSNGNGGLGNWQNTNEIMAKGKGYIVRGPGSYSNTTPQDFTAIFSGTLRNGDITVTTQRGSYTGAPYAGNNGIIITNMDDNLNLIGNPYPSAISFTNFIAANPELEGSVRIWTHGALPLESVGNPFYGSFEYNYSLSDYIVHNSLGTISGPETYNGFIPAGQGFFVILNDGSAANIDVVFNNSMRVKNNNTQFYRVQSDSLDEEGISEKHRIWLDIVSESGTVCRTLVGYTAEATYGKDRLFDAYAKIENSLSVYSLIGEEKTCIQGRPLPFDSNDIVPLGMKTTTSGSYHIAIGQADGIFLGNQIVYLKDKYLNINHNLTESPYLFTSDIGTFDDRFELRYSNETLSITDSEFQSIKIAVKENISVFSGSELIKNIQVYDMLGRLITQYFSINENTYTLYGINKFNQALILRIETESNQIYNEKVIF